MAETQEHKAVVAYYHAGHLARSMREPELAVPFAREANDVLQLPDTASSLGTALVWHGQFDEGIGFLEAAVAEADGRLKLIALTVLADAYCRRAEAALADSRNSVRASYDAIAAFELASDELDRGSADKKLRDVACEAAIAAIRYLLQCRDFQRDVDTMPDFFDKLTRRALQLSASDKWRFLVQVVMKDAHKTAVPYPIARLRRALTDVPTLLEPTVASDAELNGQIYSLLGGYGFIECPNRPERIYFHKSGLVGSRIQIGDAVSFKIEDKDDGLRAVDVEIAGRS